MWWQCKTLTPSWQRSSLWWEFSTPWNQFWIACSSMCTRKDTCLGVCANHLWETLPQTYLLPRPHGEFHLSIICLIFPQHSFWSLSKWVIPCSSLIPSTLTVVSTTFPSSTPSSTLSSLELAHQLPSRLLKKSHTDFLVLTIFVYTLSYLVAVFYWKPDNKHDVNRIEVSQLKKCFKSFRGG